MRKFILPLLLLSSLMVLNSCGESYPNAPEKKQNTKEENAEAKTVSKTNDMNVYVHFMPWFETDKTNNGKWPFHWTMNTRDPNVVDVTGKRQIASHYYPLTGPYASGDAAILDYQCLLMKYCGVDGVMVDWYGINSDNDIAKHKSNTEALAKAIAKAGLKMTIVYEDSPLADVSDKVSQARQDVRYLAETFFHKDFYVKVEGRPLLMIFGPRLIIALQANSRCISLEQCRDLRTIIKKVEPEMVTLPMMLRMERCSNVSLMQPKSLVLNGYRLAHGTIMAREQLSNQRLNMAINI